SPREASALGARQHVKQNLFVDHVPGCTLSISLTSRFDSPRGEWKRTAGRPRRDLGAARMSTMVRVELVRTVLDDFGVTTALAVIGLPSATSYYRRDHGRPYSERHQPGWPPVT